MRIAGTDYTDPDRTKNYLEIVVPRYRGLAALLPIWPFKYLMRIPAIRRIASVRLRVKTPTKAVFEELTEICEAVDAAVEGRQSELGLADCFGPVARAMSNNVERIDITERDLARMGFDLDDVSDFLGLYIFFVGELVSSKN